MFDDKKGDNETAARSQKDTTESIIDSGAVGISRGTCSATGTGSRSCVLSIVSVCVKPKKSNKMIRTYAFKDNGSDAIFCSEKLMRRKKRETLLRTIGQKSWNQLYLISGLDVSGVIENVYIDLPDVYMHTDILVSKANIPEKQDLENNNTCMVLNCHK